MLIILEGNPIAKARHRYCVRGKHVQSYDPQSEKVKDVQKELERQVAMLPQYDVQALSDVPLSVSFVFHMPIPASWSKRLKEKAAEGQGQNHIKKPDTSNLIKFYEDAANGILWPDDAQISELKAVKNYSTNPKTIIKVDLIALV